MARKGGEQEWVGQAVVRFVIDVNEETYRGMMVGRSHITGPTQEIEGRFIGRSDGSRIKGVISWDGEHNHFEMHGEEFIR